MSETMKIISLEAQNVQKLKVVRIKPDGSAIIIGGKNAQGKSSVLDCIMVALGGTKYAAKKPVRDGEKKGHIIIDLGKYIVKRTFTEAGGNSIYVENNDGARFTSPQQILNDLLGTISFDPLSFSRMDDRQQVELLKEVSGIDSSKLDAEYLEVYDDRADFNRDIKRLDSQLEGMVSHEDAPEEPVSISALTDEMEQANKANGEVEEKNEALKDKKALCSVVEEEIEDLKKQLSEKEGELSGLNEWLDENETAIMKMGLIDTSAIREKMDGVEETNSKVVENVRYNSTKEELETAEKNHAKKDARLTEIKEEKRDMVAGSKLPVKGLMFDEDGITYNNIPFSQASDAEKLRVSVALGLAMNPKLKVMLIRDGSLLDEDNLAMITKMAEKEGGQVWIERVGTGKEMTVIMEDGEVKK